VIDGRGAGRARYCGRANLLQVLIVHTVGIARRSLGSACFETFPGIDGRMVRLQDFWRADDIGIPLIQRLWSRASSPDHGVLQVIGVSGEVADGASSR